MLRFECRVIDEEGDEVLVSDFTTIEPANIDQFGGCEAVDHAVAGVLRATRRDLARRAAKEAEEEFEE